MDSKELSGSRIDYTKLLTAFQSLYIYVNNAYIRRLDSGMPAALQIPWVTWEIIAIAIAQVIRGAGFFVFSHLDFESRLEQIG